MVVPDFCVVPVVKPDFGIVPVIQPDFGLLAAAADPKQVALIPVDGMHPAAIA